MYSLIYETSKDLFDTRGDGHGEFFPRSIIEKLGHNATQLVMEQYHDKVALFVFRESENGEATRADLYHVHPECTMVSSCARMGDNPYNSQRAAYQTAARKQQRYQRQLIDEGLLDAASDMRRVAQNDDKDLNSASARLAQCIIRSTSETPTALDDAQAPLYLSASSEHADLIRKYQAADITYRLRFREYARAQVRMDFLTLIELTEQLQSDTPERYFDVVTPDFHGTELVKLLDSIWEQDQRSKVT